jgi:hypothetical protein
MVRLELSFERSGSFETRTIAFHDRTTVLAPVMPSHEMIRSDLMAISKLRGRYRCYVVFSSAKEGET